MIQFSCSSDRCCFKGKHRVDYAKIADIYETRAGKMSDVFREI